MDYDKIAKQYGAIDQPSQGESSYPDWMSGISPKDRAELTMKQHAESRKRIASLDEEISRGSNVLRELQRFGELNRNSRTGGLWENITPNIPILRGEDEVEMMAIQSRLAPSQRVEGTGSSSDRDVSLYLSGVPRIENTGPVNKNIRTGFEQQFNRAVSKKTAMEDYLNKNGNLMGFDDYWVEKNRTQDSSTKTVVREVRLKDGQIGVEFSDGSRGFK